MKKPASFLRIKPSGLFVRKEVNLMHNMDPVHNATLQASNLNKLGGHFPHFDTRLSMHDPVTIALFFVCFSLVGLMVWILSKLPPLSSVETVAERFTWRPTTAAHFKRDKEILVKYRRAYAWELFVGMTTLNIM